MVCVRVPGVVHDDHHRADGADAVGAREDRRRAAQVIALLRRLVDHGERRYPTSRPRRPGRVAHVRTLLAMPTTAAPLSSRRAAGATGTAPEGWRVRVNARLRGDVPLAVLVGCWLASRVFYYVQGVRFDTDSLDVAYQFLPRDLLEHDFWRSVWHLHAQPPLFNVFLGAGLHVPVTPSVAFGVVFRVTGLLLAVLIYELATGLGVPKVAAAIVVGIFTSAPTAAFYEHYPSTRCRSRPCSSSRRGACCGGCTPAATASGSVSSPRRRRSRSHARRTTSCGWSRSSGSRRGPRRGRTKRGRFAMLALADAPRPRVVREERGPVRHVQRQLVAGHEPRARRPRSGRSARVQRLVDDGTLSPDALVYPFSDVRRYGTSHRATGVPALDRITATRGIVTRT